LTAQPINGVSGGFFCFTGHPDGVARGIYAILLEELCLLFDTFHVLFVFLSWRGLAQRWSVMGKTASGCLLRIVARKKLSSVGVKIALST